MTEGLAASDTRDNVYALISMTASSRSGQKIPQSLQPNYRASVRKCFGNAVRYALEEDRSLDILKFTSLTYEGTEQNASAPWPSWIRCKPMVYAYDKASLLYIYSSEQEIARERIVDADLLLQSGKGNIGVDNTLFLRGWTAGTMKQTGRVLQNGLQTLAEARDFFTELYYLDRVGTLFESPQRLLVFLAGSTSQAQKIASTDSCVNEFWHMLQSYKELASDNVRRRDLLAGSHPQRDLGELWTTISGVCLHRRIFTTNGLIGIGPHAMLEGDSLVWLLGDSTPFIVGDRRYGDLLIGPCYAQWTLDGRVMQDGDAPSDETKVFELH